MTDRYDSYNGDVNIHPSGRFVKAVDYDALLADRDAWKARFEGMEEERNRECQRKTDALAALQAVNEKRDALAAQVEALKEDAERLDWLDEMNAVLNSHYGTKYRWKVIMSPMITRLMTGAQRNGHVGDIDLNDANCGSASYDKCRNAIDAARKEQS